MKFVKKLTALFLAIVMTMAMGITAFADEPTTSNAAKGTMRTLTISKAQAGHTYTAYQLVVGDLASLNNGKGTLSNIVLGTDAKTDVTAEAIVTALKDLSDEELSNAAYNYIKDDATGTTLTTSGTGDDMIASASVAVGYYVVVDTYTGADKDYALSRNVVAVVGDTTIQNKVENPGIDKQIVDTDANKAIDDSKKTDTASIGDTIEFEVTGKVPQTEGYTYYYYVLNDTLSKGLTLVDDYEKGNNSKVGGFVVTAGDETLTRDQDYYVYTTKNDDGTTSFELAFANMKGIVDSTENGINVGDAISIKYSAIVNKDAEIGKNANTNTAKLVYSNKPNTSEMHDTTNKPGTPDETKVPTGETPDYVTKTYVTEIKLTKIDSETKLALKGAEFSLTGDNLNQIIVKTTTVFTEAADGTYYKLKNGSYTTEAPIENDYTDTDGKTVKANKDLYESTTVKYTKGTETAVLQDKGQTSTNVKASVGDDGILTFTGLHVGSYTLTETTTPDGYSTISPITFTIEASQTGSTTTTGGTVTFKKATNDASNVKYDSATNTFKVTVENTPGSVLPSTGGMGTTVIYVAGIAMIVVAGIVVIARKRMA